MSTKWLAELPSTNARIVTTMCMAVGTTTFLLALIAQGIDLPEGTVAIIYAYLAAQGGFDYAQFAKKRETYQPAPPAPPDVEDAPLLHPHDVMAQDRARGAGAYEDGPHSPAMAPPSQQSAPSDADAIRAALDAKAREGAVPPHEMEGA